MDIKKAVNNVVVVIVFGLAFLAVILLASKQGEENRSGMIISTQAGQIATLQDQTASLEVQLEDVENDLWIAKGNLVIDADKIAELERDVADLKAASKRLELKPVPEGLLPGLSKEYQPESGK